MDRSSFDTAAVATPPRPSFPEIPGHNGNESANDCSLESEPVAPSFLELVIQRFEARNARPATFIEDNWAFEELQVHKQAGCLFCVYGKSRFCRAYYFVLGEVCMYVQKVARKAGGQPLLGRGEAFLANARATRTRASFGPRDDLDALLCVTIGLRALFLGKRLQVYRFVQIRAIPNSTTNIY